MKRLFFLLSCTIVICSSILSAQDSESVQDTVVSSRYAHFSECLQEVFNTADSLKISDGERSEIKWLKENRFTCDVSSPVTRRVSVKYLEWGDSAYDGDGVKEDVDKKELFREGLKWGLKAVSEDSLDHLNYENLSMSYAAIVSVAGLRSKAHLADSVRIFAEEAIRLDSTNHRAYHILGRWHFEVSKLSWLTRMLSRVIFRESPQGSFERAIDYFETAIELKNTIFHHYWLGVAYLESGDKEKALKEFILLQDLPIQEHNEPYFKEEAEKLIEKHS